MNHYLYCKYNNKNFKIDDRTWLFKIKNGWTDYFEKIELIKNNNNNNNNNTEITTAKHGITLADYSIQEYKNIIPEIYIYNEHTKQEINKVKLQFNLIDNEYDAIFIRRGDKLISESKKIDETTYIDLLLKKNPFCSTIFLQTDDYNSFIGLEKYIKEHNLNIKIHTICDKNSLGVVVFSNLKKQFNDKTNNITQNKSVDEMNHDEKYKHTMDMIIGVDILRKSNICVTDFQSNVARFVKLAHNNSDNVFDVLSNNNIDYTKKICPAYSF
jgi:hypothetical protein